MLSNHVLINKSWLLPPVSIHDITITPLSTPLVAGQSYTLYCNGTVLGNTSLTPVVTWRNSTGVVTSGNGITVSNGILTFNPLHTSHGGQYTCQSALNYPVISIISSMIDVAVRSMSICAPDIMMLNVSPSVPPHPSPPHTMPVHHSTSPVMFSSSHKWTLLLPLTPCGLDQEDRSPVVVVESPSPLVSTRPLYSSILSTPVILECTTVQLVFLHQVSSMWTPQ